MDSPRSIGSSPASSSQAAAQPSPWDQIFADIEDLPPLMPTQTPRVPKPAAQRQRRQAMTARELRAFDDMFRMIFDAADSRATGPDSAVSAGLGSSRLGDLYGSMRSQSKRLARTRDVDVEVDRMKEEMSLCATDEELLAWAERSVFSALGRFEDAARSASTGPKQRDPDATDAKPGASAAPQTKPGVHPFVPLDGATLPLLQPAAYGPVLAHLMSAFRDKFRDPHLALAAFAHAAARSPVSYVFGCTAPAYNELLATRWRSFRDLRGVADALGEMRANGVEPDSQTRRLLENVRRESGERNVWAEEDSVGGGEVWALLARIEALMADAPAPMSGPASRSDDPKATPRGILGDLAKSGSTRGRTGRKNAIETWKREALDGDDGWEFDKWESARDKRRPWRHALREQEDKLTL